MKRWRTLANECRDIPLLDVVAMLGGEQDKVDKQKWHTSRGPVWLGKSRDSKKFYDHKSGIGGGGAIDLVMHIECCDFKRAVELLMPILGIVAESPTQAANPSPPLSTPEPSFSPPAKATKHLARIVEYLTEARGLPQSLIVSCVDSGTIYADSRRNAVFLCTDPYGHTTGAELRGTGEAVYKGMAPGSRRGAGFFTLPHVNPHEVVIAESAIDALSYRALFPQEAVCVVSTAGVMPDCPALVTLAQRLGISTLTVAYDNDPAGNEAAEKLMANIARSSSITVRRKAPEGKDWNEALQHCDGDLFGEGA